MNTPLTLRNGRMRCDVLPALGGSLAGLWCGEWPVLHGTPTQLLTSVRNAASYPLVPYSNRIGFAQLQWNQATYALTPNFAPEPHAIHGVGWERAWSVEAFDGTSLHLHYCHNPDTSWPFAFEARQTLRLAPAQLEMALEIRNLADHPAPVGLGWHPYFSKRAETRIHFEAEGRWDMDADKLPTRRLPHPGLATDCHQLEVDHCFDGWRGALELRDGLRTVRVSSDLTFLVVFTNPARDSIAVEPVSHVNNALALAHQRGLEPGQLGVRVLGAGETFAASMCIAVEDLT